ncbi:hypothetical protein DYB34_010028, partial [Aphanomyces astaci]
GIKVTPIVLLESARCLWLEVHDVWTLCQQWRMSHAMMHAHKFTMQSWTSGDLSLQTFCLKQLNDLDMWSHSDKIRTITYHARIDSETEAKLQVMKARWAATELICQGLQLDPVVVDDLLAALDNDLMQVQCLMQLTSQPLLYQALATWSNEINYIQDTLELWVAAQHDWVKLDRIFQLPDIQQSVRHANVEFQVLSRKWKAMMKGVRTNTLIQHCVREVTNRTFLGDAKALFERLWKQLVLFLHEKRREFPRFNFVSDRELLAIMAGTTLSLSQPCHDNAGALSVVVSKCFEHEESSFGDAPTYSIEVFAVHGQHDETISLNNSVKITQRPEGWMKELAKVLRRAMKENLRHLMAEYSDLLQYYLHDKSHRLQKRTKECIVALRQQSTTKHIHGLTTVTTTLLNALNVFQRYEYLGPQSVIAMTPLTERMMWSMSMAFRLHSGSLLYGETGVSKQASIRELVNCIGALCVVYDCSIQFNMHQLGRILGGIVQCQAYVSVVGLEHVECDRFGLFVHQVKRLQHALKTHKEKICLDSTVITLQAHHPSIHPNYGVFCKLTTPSQAHTTAMVRQCASAFVSFACKFSLPDVAVLIELYFTVVGFRNVDRLTKTLHSFLLLLGTTYCPSPGEFLSVRIVRKIVDLSSTDEQQVVAYAVWNSIGSRISPERKLAFLALLHRHFPSFRHIHLDVTKTKSHIHDQMAVRRLVPTPISTRKVAELHDLCSIVHRFCTGEIASGKSTTIALLSGLRKYAQGEQRVKCFRIATATLAVAERNVLLVGASGVGKSSFTRRALHSLSDRNMIRTIRLGKHTSAISFQECQEQIRQIVDVKGVYHRTSFEYVELSSLVFVGLASLNPSSVMELPLRLLRHFHMVHTYIAICLSLFQSFILPTIHT